MAKDCIELPILTNCLKINGNVKLFYHISISISL